MTIFLLSVNNWIDITSNFTWRLRHYVPIVLKVILLKDSECYVFPEGDGFSR